MVYLLFLGICTTGYGGQVTYSEDFSAGLPTENWTYYGSNSSSRIQVVDGRMRMDSSNVYVINEAIFTVDLEGATSASLSFQHQHSGDNPHAVPTNYSGHATGDGVSLSVDGVNWYRIHKTSQFSASLATYTVDLIAARDSIRDTYDNSFALNATVQIKFQQYDNGAYPTDSRDWDNIMVTAELPAKLILTEPTDYLEGATGITATIQLTDAPDEDLEVTLIGDAFFNLPATVSIPADQTSAEFSFSIVDDALQQGIRTGTITFSATGYTSAAWELTIHDDESPYSVSFDLGGKATRSSGGELSQQIIFGNTATPPTLSANPGWLFYDWDTDFNTVSTDITVTATYEADTDFDLLPDTWETENFTTLSASDGNSDFDGDTRSDSEEFEAGTDPKDPNDFFQVLAQSYSNNGSITLRFNSNDNHPGRRYRILYTDDLSANPWSELPGATFTPDAGNETEVTFDAPNGSAPYFISLEAFIR